MFLKYYTTYVNICYSFDRREKQVVDALVRADPPKEDSRPEDVICCHPGSTRAIH